MIFSKITFFFIFFQAYDSETISVPDYLNKCYRYEDDAIKQDLLCEVSVITDIFAVYGKKNLSLYVSEIDLDMHAIFPKRCA